MSDDFSDGDSTITHPVDILAEGFQTSGDRIFSLVRESEQKGIAPLLAAMVLQVKLCLFRQIEWDFAVEPDEVRPAELTPPPDSNLEEAMTLYWKFRKELSTLFSMASASSNRDRRSTQRFLTMLLSMLESIENE
jgi:hypothetical protein